MKKIFLILFIILISSFFVGCKEEKERANIVIYVDGEYYGERLAYIGDSIDFKLEDDSYMFLGWYDESGENLLDNTIINGDMNLYAKTIEMGTKYKINYHFTDGASFKTVNYPRVYTVGQTTKLVEPTKTYNFEFSGWYLNGELISEISATMYGDIDLYDSWIDNNTYYNITYSDDGATYYSSEKREKLIAGETYQLPYVKKDGYYFRGWYLDQEYTKRIYSTDETINSDITIYAKFDEKKASDTYVSFVGDSISTYHGYIPNDAGAYYPTYLSFPAEQTYFLQVCSGMGYNFLKNDSYAGCRLSTDVQTETAFVPRALSDTRINGLTDGTHDPDILILHIGNNDYSQGIDKSLFRTCVIQYVEKVRKLYDDVEIYFCLHPANGYAESFTPLREGYNKVLEELATECNFGLMDLTKCWDSSNYKDYIFSNSHPNVAGFKAMADLMIETLKEDHNNKY